LLLYTIGFTQKTACQFFTILRDSSVRRLVDIRLNNVSQLAGFAKRDDLAFFLKELCGAEYSHEPMLAPTSALLDAYRKQKGGWEEYERGFRALLAERRVEDKLSPSFFTVPTVLLCSEPSAEHCHRRLVIEHLQQKWRNVEVVHLP
jgi:uncharacterized protein (DUF488 family)